MERKVLVALHEVEHLFELAFGGGKAKMARVVVIERLRAVERQFGEFLEIKILFSALSVGLNIVFMDLLYVFGNDRPFGVLHGVEDPVGITGTILALH